MTSDQIKAAVINFQRRTILQESPNPIFKRLRDILYRYTQDDTCIEEDEICKIVTYLDCNLPKKSPITIDADLKVEKIKLTTPCDLPYNIFVVVAANNNPFAGEFTLTANSEYFIFDDCYYFDMPKFVEENSSLFPSNLSYSYFYKERSSDTFVEQIPYTLIGYIQ